MKTKTERNYQVRVPIENGYRKVKTFANKGEAIIFCKRYWISDDISIDGETGLTSLVKFDGDYWSLSVPLANGTTKAINSFKSHSDSIRYAQEAFGADRYGNINLVCHTQNE